MPVSASAAETAVGLQVNGVRLYPEVAPQLLNNRTMVPIRAVSEALGADVAWDAATRTITLTKGARVIRLEIDSRTATIDGNPVTLDAPPTIVGGRTLVPLRFVSEGFGAEVAWQGDARTAVVKLVERQGGKTPEEFLAAANAAAAKVRTYRFRGTMTVQAPGVPELVTHLEGMVRTPTDTYAKATVPGENPSFEMLSVGGKTYQRIGNQSWVELQPLQAQLGHFQGQQGTTPAAAMTLARSVGAAYAYGNPVQVNGRPHRRVVLVFDREQLRTHILGTVRAALEQGALAMAPDEATKAEMQLALLETSLDMDMTMEQWVDEQTLLPSRLVMRMALRMTLPDGRSVDASTNSAVDINGYDEPVTFPTVN